MLNVNIENKVAIVTGASSGIGKQTAIKMAQEKAKIVLVSRDESRLQQLQQNLKAVNSNVIYVAADIMIEANIEKVIQTTVDKFNSIDILVNAAGIYKSGSIEDTKVEDWDDMMQLNLKSVFLLCQKAIPHLINSQGNIVNVSSVVGLRSFPGILAYCVSKAGLDQFTRCIALELAGKGVRVNAVNPGVTITELHRRGGMDDRTYQAFLERSKETHPVGRPGTPEEIADLILFLASPLSSWITGVTYSIDGGRAQTCAR